MNKLLLSFSSLFLFVVPVVHTTNNQEKLEVENKTSINQKKYQQENLFSTDKISVSTLKLKETTVDLSLYDENSNIDDIKWDVFLSISTENSDLQNLEEVVFDILINEDNWKITGLDYKIPEPGKEKKYNVKIAALPANPQYSGILKAPVKYINTNDTQVPELKSLAKDVKIDDLGNIQNPTLDSLENIFRTQNSQVNMNEIELDYWDYSKIIYRVKPNSNYYYQGSVTVTYNSSIKFKIEEFRSGLLEVEAYNSTQTKSKSKTYSYRPEFGVEKFRQKYKILRVYHSGKSYTSNKSGNIPKELKEFSDIKLDTGTKTLLADEYNGSVNWNLFSIETTISFYKDEEIRITFNIMAQAYASWMNAYYSRAGVELNVSEFVFS